jgi:protein TonB
MFYLESGYGKHDRLRNALLAALAIHALLIFSITFDIESGQRYSPQIEITLANRPASLAPEEARHIAQANQEGSGDQADHSMVSSQALPLPSQGESAHQNLPEPADQSARDSRDLVATRASARRVTPREQQEREEQRALLQGISPEVDRLTQEVASLEAELDEQTRTLAERPRVKRLTSVAARESADAAYLHSWLRRLEAVGNRYYPEASVRYGLYGSLRLLVVIRKDGTLEDVTVLSSSGYAVLDEAAIKTVRMAAPYAPFPAELKATTDKLEIIRTWHFEENRLSSQ